METIIAAAITGGLALLGVILTINANSRRLEHKLEVSQAVTDTKLDELTREVREHNNFAKRVPVLEEQMKVANHRIEDLEKGR
ncbi:MAG: hypothetical protein ACI4P4_15450 [Faecousia sp.]